MQLSMVNFAHKSDPYASLKVAEKTVEFKFYLYTDF